MQSRGRYGYWVAFLGVVCQLAGLSWDALLHHFDPQLAQNEGVFSLTNPSHLLTVVGLGLTALGVVWGLVLSAMGSSRGPRSIAAPATASVALVVLWGAMAGIGLATGGISGEHDHDTAAGHDGTAAVENETLDELKQVLRDSGTAQALTRLEELAASDTGVLAQAHVLVHQLGRYSYEFFGNDARTAFANCADAFESGCYHGVLEGFLRSKPVLNPEDVSSVCGSVIDTSESQFIKFQCVHGMGHGLTMYYSHDMFTALTNCDYLPTDWDRSSCYGGVFMENIVNAQHADHGGPGQHESALKRDDLLYPCNAVEEKYRGACYMMQSSVILMYNSYDFAAAFQTCGGAPEAYISTCYQSMGRDISGYTLRDPNRSLELCGLGAPEYAPHCFGAVAKQFIDVAGETDGAFGFCRMVGDDAKSTCYQSIGEMVASLYADLSLRSQECSKAEDGYVEACSRGAGV